MAPSQPLSTDAAQAAALARSAALQAQLRAEITAGGGWLGFERFMHLALYAPGLGYYAGPAPKFGAMPASGSDFVTAPELSPLFGQALARQVGQVLEATGSAQVVEFGAGSGALAEQLLQALPGRIERYEIVEVSAALAQRQAERLARFAPRVRWLDAWPERIEGVVLGNEVLDAMPVALIHFDGQAWQERGVVLAPAQHSGAPAQRFIWADRPTTLKPPLAADFVPGSVTEIQRQAEAFVRGLAPRLARGAALFIDYGFPEAEFYLPQRVGGTLMCHRAHRADADPLVDVGLKDITAHVNFTAIALAAQEAGLVVEGYSSQAHFLFNLGLAEDLAAADAPARARGLKLVHEHEMGELFKVLALGRGLPQALTGFARGDRRHRL